MGNFISAPLRSLCSKICVCACVWTGATWLLSLPLIDLLNPKLRIMSPSMLTYLWVYQKYVFNLSKLEIWALPSAGKVHWSSYQQYIIMQENGDAVFSVYLIWILVTWWQLRVVKQLLPGCYYLLSIGHLQHKKVENGAHWSSLVIKTHGNNSEWLLSLLACFSSISWL